MNCPYCGKKLTQAYRRKKGFEPMRSYACEQCEEAFVTIEDRPKCPACGKDGNCTRTSHVGNTLIRNKICACGEKWVSYESIELYVHQECGLVVTSTELRNA